MLITTKVLDHFKSVEGFINHFYLDSEGIVTIGIGCVVSLKEALSLPMFSKSTNISVGSTEIEIDYDNIKRSEVGHTPDYYSKRTELRTTDGVIENLFKSRFDSIQKQVGYNFLDFSTYSEGVQLVLMDFAFNLGVFGLLSKFPHFCAAIKGRDFRTAASESKRVGIQDSRNKWAESVLLDEALNEV